MAELKTRPTGAPVTAYLGKIADPVLQADARQLNALLSELSGTPATMWGSGIVGFGDYSYPAKNGTSLAWFRIGYAARSKGLVLYLMTGVEPHADLIEQLGPCTTGKGCLYLPPLSKTRLPVLRQLIRTSLKQVKSPAAARTTIAARSRGKQ